MRSKKLIPETRYMILPLDNVGGWFLPEDRVQFLQILEEGVLKEEYELILSEQPRGWGTLYLDDYKGKEIEIRLEGGDESTFDLIRFSDEHGDAATLYREPQRPLVHFSPMHGFMNDPNGLLYYRGTYHLFAQENPYGYGMGNTHWLHAVSTDLMHWEEKPYALRPDGKGRMYSGGGIVDPENTSGLKCGDDDPIFLFYCAAGCKTRWSKGNPFTICCAYSLDGGVSFTKYEHNPIIPFKSFLNRDPKVLWNPEDREWMMMIYLDGDNYTLYYSKDLLHWDEGETIRGYNSAECPDLFYLNLDDDPSKRKLVLWFCSDNYRIGTLKNRHFASETELIEGCSHQVYSDYPNHAKTAGGYASQTFTNVPGDRVIQLGWMMMNTGNAPFVSTMTVPNELKLRTVDGKMRIITLPAEEIKEMYMSDFVLRNRGLEEFERVPMSVWSPSDDITLKLTVYEGQLHAVSVRGVLITYDSRTGMLMTPMGAFKIKTAPGLLELRFITDRTSVEIYTADGTFTTAVKVMQPDFSTTGVKPVYIEPCTGVDLEVHNLKNMWEKEQ